MITTYLLITAFVMGSFVGSVAESKNLPDATEWLLLVLLAVFWPFLGYVYWCDWRKNK